MTRLKRLAKLRQFVKGMDVEDYLMTQLRQNWLAIEASLGNTLNNSTTGAEAESESSYQESSSCGLFSTTSTSPVDVTNLSVSIDSTGGMVVIGLKALVTSIGSVVGAANASGNSSAHFLLLKNGVEIARFAVSANGSGAVATASRVPCSSINFHDNSFTTGVADYKLQAAAVTAGSALVWHASLFAYEI